MQQNIPQYLDAVHRAQHSCSHTVIYGAGRKAVSLYNLFKNNGIKIDAFIVTNTEENKDTECGLPVFGVSDNPFTAKNTLVLIGVRQRWNQAVIQCLEAYGYIYYIEAPEGIEYLGRKDAERSERSVLQLTLQIGCPIHCKYCPQGVFVQQYRKNVYGELVLNFEKYVYFLSKVNKDVILEFAGFSEPFLNKECIRMLEYAANEGYDIELFTTLQGLNDMDFDRMLRLSYREVVLHIPDKDGNSNIPITEKYLDLLNKVLSAQKADGSPFVDWGSCHGIPAERIKPFIKNKLRVLTQLHNRAGNLGFKELEKQNGVTGKIQCSGAKHYDHNVLLPDGTVLLCDSDWGMQHPLGNLNQQTYQEVLSGEAISAIKEKCVNEIAGELLCRNCCYAVPQQFDA